MVATQTITFTSATQSGSDASWSNLSNVLASDDSRATVDLQAGSSTSNVLHVSGFTRNVPPEAQILGIVANCEWRDVVGVVNATTVSLEESEVVPTGSDDKSGPTALPGTEAVSAFGSSSDKWNAPFHLYSDLAARGFGIGVDFLRDSGGAGTEAQVDHIEAVVHYNVPGRFRTRGLRRWANGHR